MPPIWWPSGAYTASGVTCLKGDLSELLFASLKSLLPVMELGLIIPSGIETYWTTPPKVYII